MGNDDAGGEYGWRIDSICKLGSLDCGQLGGYNSRVSTSKTGERLVEVFHRIQSRKVCLLVSSPYIET